MKNTFHHLVTTARQSLAGSHAVRSGWRTAAAVVAAIGALATAPRAGAETTAMAAEIHPVMDLVVQRVELNLDRHSVSYDTTINGVARTVSYRFRDLDLVIVRVEDGDGAEVLTVKVTSRRITVAFGGKLFHQPTGQGFLLPEDVDPYTRYALKSRLVALPRLGIAGLIGRLVESGGDNADASAEMSTIVDWFLTIWEVGCTAYSSTATCDTGDGRTQSVTCGCGEIAQCNKFSYTICIYITVTVEGEQREVESCETYTDCACSCFDPDLDFASGPYSE